MSDLINRQDVLKLIRTLPSEEGMTKGLLEMSVKQLPSAEPEKTVYIPDTKAIPTARSCVDLAEKVTVTFYDEEHEEWAQRTVTIEDVLDSVCDDYTILPSAERKGHWIKTEDGYYVCSLCKSEPHCSKGNYCMDCGARMVSEE